MWKKANNLRQKKIKWDCFVYVRRHIENFLMKKMQLTWKRKNSAEKCSCRPNTSTKSLKADEMCYLS